MHAAIWRGLGLGAILVTFVQTSAVAQAPTPYQALTKEQPNTLQWKTAVAQVAAPPGDKTDQLPTPAPLLPTDQQPIPITPSTPDSAKLAQLRADVAALIGTAQDTPVIGEGGSSERARLQGQLEELLKRLNSQPPGGMRPPVVPPPTTKFDPTNTRPIDTLRMAMNLFRDNDFDAALRAFRFIEPAQLPPEDRPFVQYMIATCLRRLNRLSEAAVVYREVAQTPDDEFIAGSAVSQLSLIRTQQELEAQLEQLRIRMKGR